MLTLMHFLFKEITNVLLLTTRALQNIVKKYVAASGLDPASISAHKLRHTSATLMYKYGRVDIRSL